MDYFGCPVNSPDIENILCQISQKCENRLNCVANVIVSSSTYMIFVKIGQLNNQSMNYFISKPN